MPGSAPSSPRPSRVTTLAFAAVLLLGFGALGCKTINVAEYSVKDSETHRQAVRDILSSVANDSGLQDASQESSPLGIQVIASYSRDFGISRWPLNLSAAVVADRVRTILTQIKHGRKRTKEFLEIQNRLQTEFTESFGSEHEFKVYDGAYPLGL